MPLEGMWAKPGPSDLLQEAGLSVEQLHCSCLWDALSKILFTIASILGDIPHPIYICLSFWYSFKLSFLCLGSKTLVFLSLTLCFSKDNVQWDLEVGGFIHFGRLDSCTTQEFFLQACPEWTRESHPTWSSSMGGRGQWSILFRCRHRAPWTIYLVG